MTNTGRPTMEKNSVVYEDYIGLIWSIVNKQRIEHFIQDEDLFQELSLVWLRCIKAYKYKEKISFVNYFYTSALNYIMRLTEQNQKEIYLFSLDYNISLTPKHDVVVGNLHVDDYDLEQAYINEEIIYQFLSHPYGAIAKYLLQGKTIAYAADQLEVDKSTATRWMQKMIEDVRKTQFEKSVLWHWGL